MLKFVMLKSFVTVAHEKSISKAAQILNITQSTLSTRIKNLEDELGVPLFYRASQGIRLSYFGKIFLPYAQKSIESWNLGVQTIETEKGDSISMMRISAASPFNTYIMPRLLPILFSTFPDVNLQVLRNTGFSSEILKMVLNSFIDIAFINNVEELSDTINKNKDILNSIPLYEDDIVLLAKPSHHLSEAKEISFSELIKEQVVTLDQRSPFTRHLHRHLEAENVQLEMSSYINSVAGILEIVKQSDMLTFLPRLSANVDITTGSLVELTLPVQLKPIFTSMVYLQNQNVQEASQLIKEKVALIIELLKLPCRMID